MMILNVVICYALWKVSDIYFELQRPFLGWLCVAISALNGAAAMAELI